MEGNIPLVELGICLLFLILNMIVYAYSAAVQKISDQELEQIREENEKKYRKIIRIIEDPFRFIHTVQTSSMIMNLVAGAYLIRMSDDVASQYLSVDSKAVSFFVFVAMTILLTCIFVTISVVIPKGIGKKYSYKIVNSLLGVTYGIMIVFLPVTSCVYVASSLILRVFGIRLHAAEESVTEEDIISVVQEGHEQGVLLESEAEMISNIVEFGDKEAKDIMTPRMNISAVDASWTLRQTAEYILGENKSRFPVYEENIDNILGIVNLRDVMEALNQIGEEYANCEDEDLVSGIDSLIRPATFIPETRKINVLFRNMQSEKIHMAIVVDEYGQTAGIVAMEDVLEEIVGNILDEYDEEDADVVRKEDGSFIANGAVSLVELSEQTGIEYPEEYDTLNGYLTAKLERILGVSERPELEVDGVYYRILDVKNKMISLVQIIIKNRD